MKGYVSTPDALVDKMVDRLFLGMVPKPTDFLLDPGCADGQFIAGVLRWCHARDVEPPNIVGVELNPAHAIKAQQRFQANACVEIIKADYLAAKTLSKFRFVIGNPPYVSLEYIKEKERTLYRTKFFSARGRFDLYMLFFEQALKDMLDDGRMVFVTPEKFIYVETAMPLRKILTSFQVESIALVAEDTFSDYTTYPSVTTLHKSEFRRQAAVHLRDGTTRDVGLPKNGATWLPILMGHEPLRDGKSTLSNYCRRISAGVATGADGVFVRPIGTVTGAMRQFAYQTLAGRDISLSRDHLPPSEKMLLVPYDPTGTLLPEQKLGALGAFLRKKENKEKLMQRSCTKNKAWYAFHDNCPLPEITLPKIICKDIGQRPKFWIDRTGSILPLHSLYYIVPNTTVDIDALCAWLNGPESANWLRNHCQRAANGFIRLQSRVIKQLPIPDNLLNGIVLRVA